ncbi:MAG: hypothetical protein ABFS12_08220 [Bacteroidota bacterium]
MALEKPPIEFPRYAWGVDLLFSDGGFGLGTFFRRAINTKLTGFIDLSFSESKGEREFEYYDYWGRPIVIGKENRVFLIPLTLGLQYRLFEKELTDNLRPYLNGGIGPSLIIATPFKEEFFNSFKFAKASPGVGGYLGFGADFGLSKSNLLGLNIRYQYMRFLNGGVEHMTNQVKTELHAIYVSIKLGIMF